MKTRNPIARAVRRIRPQVVKNKKRFTRKQKHKKAPE